MLILDQVHSRGNPVHFLEITLTHSHVQQTAFEVQYDRFLYITVQVLYDIWISIFRLFPDSAVITFSSIKISIMSS